MKYELIIWWKNNTMSRLEVIGHYFPSDAQGFVVLVREDYSKILHSLDLIASIEIPKEVHMMTAARHPSESQG